MLAGEVELRVKPKRGKVRVVEATPEALADALRDVGTEVKWIQLEKKWQYMRFDVDKELDYGDTPLQGEPTLHRASAGSIGEIGALPALEAFLSGSDEWRKLYEWEDVSYELGTRITSHRKFYFVAGIILTLIMIMLDALGLLD